MEQQTQQSPPTHKMPGWIGAFVVLLALCGGGWFAWSQFGGGGPRVGEKIELAPETQARRDAQQFGQNVQRALQNLGRNRATTRPAATRPAATRPANRPATQPAR